jgi:hypothetical protein
MSWHIKSQDYIISYQIILYQIISYQIILYQIILYQILGCSYMNNNKFIHKHGREACCRIIGRRQIRKWVGVIKYNLRAMEYQKRFRQNWDTIMSSASWYLLVLVRGLNVNMRKWIDVAKFMNSQTTVEPFKRRSKIARPIFIRVEMLKFSWM